MDVKFGPNAVDEPNLLYKLQRKIKVFNTEDPLPNRGYSLVASASKYGLVFIGSPDGTLSVYHLKDLIDTEAGPEHISIKLQEKPTHIGVSCDHELLAVTGGQLLNIYKVTNFQNPTMSPSISIKCDTNPSTIVSALQWNPCIPDTIALAFFDGTLLVSQVNNAQVAKAQTKARCICWSPKGKQLVVGNNDGTLCQYKPDLSPMKTVPPPKLFDGAPIEALAVYWISTYQFAVVYRNAAGSSRPAVTIVNTPKTGQLSCLNYEDVCFSMGSNRPWYYYLYGLAPWNIILSSSSNSTEIATLGSSDGANWQQWSQTDEARPELPLTDKKQENYPVGLCIDTCAIHQLSWGENETLPHMPLLHVISQSGLLITFNVVNLNKQAAQVCSPPQPLVLHAAAITSSIPGAISSQPSAPPPASTPVVQPTPQPIIQPPQVAPIPTATPFGASINSSFSLKQPPNQGFAAVPILQAPVPQPPIPQAPIPQAPVPQAPVPQAPVPQVEARAAPIGQPLPSTPQPIPSKPQPATEAPKPQPTLESEALKAEQERLNQIKANEELKEMLVREVNDFQVELHQFVTKTRQITKQLQSDVNSVEGTYNLQGINTERLKKECSVEEMRNSVVQLKLELVRACAAVAEARTHSDAKELNQWTQADPLTNKRVASIKSLSYYVRNQLEQAHRALDYKWNQMLSNDNKLNKPGQRMIRPILDDVYQPLVRQQEILSRQQAVLKTLKKTLTECEIQPIFKSTSLLRSTPFKNKDPLSKLTKNILNMSIEPENNKNEPLLTPQKLDALRDMLSNHKTVKIKPIKVVYRPQNLLAPKSFQPVVQTIPSESSVVHSPKPFQPVVQTIPSESSLVHSPKSKQVISLSHPVPTLTPVANTRPNVPVDKPSVPTANVARILFAHESTETAERTDNPLGLSQEAINTRSVLKELLQNKQLNNANTFMGQNICSPTAFVATSTPTPPPTGSKPFVSLPIVGLNNMLSKFTPQSFVPESKPQSTVFKPKPDDTGETALSKQVVKLPANIFGMQTSTPLAGQNTLDVWKTSSFTFGKENKTNTNKADEKSIENVPDDVSENMPHIVPKLAEDKSGIKPLTAQTANKPTVFRFTQPTVTSTIFATPGESTSAEKVQPVMKTENEDSVSKSTEKLESTASSIFAVTSANASKSQVFFGASTSTLQTASIFDTSVAASTPMLEKRPTTPTEKPPTTPSEKPTVSDEKPVSAEKQREKPEELSDSGEPTVPTEKPATPVEKPITPTVPVTEKSTASSLFGAAASQLSTKATGSIFSASSTPSVFGTGSIFGATTTKSETTQGDSKPTELSTVLSSSPPAFESTPPSIFTSAAKPLPSFNTTSTAPASVVEGTSQSSSQSVFGTTSTASVFGSTTTTQSVFGTTTATTQASVFGTATTQAPVFGTPTTTQSSVFSATTSTSQPSIFASTTEPSVFGSSTTQTPVFGATTTTQASIFGTPTPTTQSSIFGTPTTTQSSVFGTLTPGTQTSVFGTPTQTTQTSVFGTPTQTTQASVFGTPTQTTQASVFGTPTQTTQASVFGTPTQTTQASVFGTPTQTTQASVFGTPTTTQASVFGTPTQSVFGGTTQASVFGATQSQGSVFGSPTTTASSSLFGGAENLFAAASISTTSAPSQSTGGNIFGGSSSGSVFGGGSPNVFAKTSFGQSNNTPASNIFAGSTSFDQNPANTFWAGANKSSEFGASAFGQQATTQASSIFGGGGGSFSSPSTGGAFGSPQQASSVFGSPQQQGASAFGGSAVFGSKPAFGQSTGFGSPTSGGFGAPSPFSSGFNRSPSSGFGAGASFGSGATFGGTAFGNTSPSAGFGSPTQSNATFENLANQNTVSFGNLAQQSGQPSQSAPTFNTSPSFTGWRG